METMPINRVSAEYNISSRALRYWEEAGLFESSRDPSSGWRVYDEEALRRIRLTELLRRLDIPVRGIRDILGARTASTVSAVLSKRLSALERSGAELALQRAVLLALMAALSANRALSHSTLEELLLPVVPTEKRPDPIKVKEMLSMPDMNSIVDKIRIIRLDPMRTAAFTHVGQEPEDYTCATVVEWMTEQGLLGTMRLFGFNTEPYPTEESPEYGFGYCATVPADTKITAPLFEKQLPGGSYAALDVPSGGDPSEPWRAFNELMASGNWEWAFDEARPGLEEHIPRGDTEGYRITILLPVKRRDA